MIAYIEGRLAEVCANACVVVTEGGVGYEVFVPQQTLLALPARGSLVRFYTCHIVREDAQELYGFERGTNGRRFWCLFPFPRLERVPLSVFSPRSDPPICGGWLYEDDVLALTQVSGIGKKSAQHIFLELSTN